MTEEEDEGQVLCPYCGIPDGCQHLLLVVDLTFHEAMGGELNDAFCERLAPSSEDEDDDSGDEYQERFAALMEEVERTAD